MNERREIAQVVRDLCDRHDHERVIVPPALVNEAIKELALPTSNPTASYLMREQLRTLIESELEKPSSKKGGIRLALP